MGRAGTSRCRSALAGLLLILSTALPAAPTVPGSTAAAESSDPPSSFRQAVWTLYGPSAALGPDARGRTLAQDIADWVLTVDVRRQLDGNIAAGESPRLPARSTFVPPLSPPSLEELQRRLNLIGMYWLQQPTLRRQRALWLLALDSAPREKADVSRVRIARLESHLQQNLAPTMMLDDLKHELMMLTNAYDWERGVLMAFAPDIHGATLDRPVDLPCPAPETRDPGGVPTHGLRAIKTPAASDFYPGNARRDQLTGKVLVEVTVDATGCGRRFEIVRSSGAPALDEAALELAAHVEYGFAERDSKPVEAVAQMPVNFVLTDDVTTEAAPGAGTSLSALLQRGNELLNRGEFDQAISALDEALALDPEATTAYAQRGLAHLWKRDTDPAREDFETALRLVPQSAPALSGRGVLEFLSGDCQSALADLSRSLDYDARRSFTLRWRAEAYSCLGRDEEALADLARSEKVAPDTFSAYARRAGILRALHRPDEALTEIAGVLAASNAAGAHLAAGRMYAAAGKPGEALAETDLGVRLSPTEKAYVERAAVRPISDLRGQREDFESAMKVNPKSRLAQVGLIRTRALEGDEDLEAASAALAQTPDDTFALLRRGIDRWKAGDSTGANDDLQALIWHAETDELNDDCYVLALLDVALDRALEACNLALGKMPRLAGYLDSRGLVFLRLGRLKDALADYDLALKQSPHSGSSLYCRGLVLLRLGRSGARDIDQAIALNATIGEFYAAFGLKP
jgi:TonB family protein